MDHPPSHLIQMADWTFLGEENQVEVEYRGLSIYLSIHYPSIANIRGEASTTAWTYYHEAIHDPRRSFTFDNPNENNSMDKMPLRRSRSLSLYLTSTSGSPSPSKKN